MSKAIVLSGGASRGAYQAGALLRLAEEEGNKYQVFTGISVGSINAAHLAQYDNFQYGAQALVDWWQRINDKNVKKHWLPFSFVTGFWKTGLYNTKPLRDLLKNNLSRELILATGNKLRIGAVDLQSSKYKVFDENYPDLHNAIMASSAFPLMFPAQELDGRIYTDGGVRNVTPLKSAIDIDEVTELDVVLCEPASHPDYDKPKNVIDIALFTLAAMMDEIVVNDITIARLCNQLVAAGIGRGKRHLSIRLFRPKTALPGSPISFNPDDIQKMIDIGYHTTNEQLKLSNPVVK